MKIKFLLLILTGLTVLTAGAKGIEDMQGLNLKHIKIPFYRKNILERLIFADNGERNGRLVQCNSAFIDTLLEKIDVDKIPDAWQTKIYPLDAPLKVMLGFWKNRFNISEYII